MAAPNAARSTQLLHQILRLPILADAIADYVYKSYQPQPVELGNPVEANNFLDAARSLIPVGLQPIGMVRRFDLVRFTDLQANLLGRLDTPIPYQGRVKNMEVVHDLDANPGGIGLTPAAHAAQDYGLSRNLLGGLTMRLTVLTRFSHEFQFGQNNLDGLFVIDTRHQTRLNGRLQVWIGDIIADVGNQPIEASVCLSDRWAARNNDWRQDIDNRGWAIATIATRMLNNVGTVCRIC